MAAKFTLAEIAGITGGELIGNADTTIRRILLDSRRYHPSDDQIFFAIKGKNQDGRAYIHSLHDRGLQNFVVQSVPTVEMPSANFIVVENTLDALQILAAHIREKSLATVIGITGSNGKTVVKEWLWQILRPYFSVCRNPGSYNSQVGVPISVWELEQNDDYGIFEAGISEPNEMKNLEQILKPEYGIITNIGSAHSQFFESNEQKAREKLILFKNSKKVIYCMDDAVLRKVIPANDQSKWTGWSRSNRNATLYIIQNQKKKSGCQITGRYKGREMEIFIPFSDDASVENAIHCWLMALELDLDDDLISERLKQLQPVAMRLELKAGRKGSIIINDAYNSDLESLNNALTFLDQQAHQKEKVIVLSDILQSGLEPSKLYAEIASILHRHNISEMVGIGSEIKKSSSNFSLPAQFYETTEEFLRESFRHNWEDKALLIKGARKFQLEQISRKLESKTHETVLEIHLSKLVQNLNYYRSKLKENVKVMAMVKAFCYGSGSYEIASLLQFHNIDYLAVAYADEGVELRKAGIVLPILVLNAEPTSFEDIIHYGLEPEIYNLRILELFRQTLDHAETTSDHLVHLKLDTGMHRLGFEEEQLPELLKQLKQSKNIKVASVFSHLAAADDPFKKNFTESQISRFQKMCTTLEVELGPLSKHMLNSSGIERYPEAQFNMVRLGIGLYGISSDVQERKFLQQTSEFKATVSQVKNIKAGETVGYGQSFTATKDMKIATITAGYADGLRRSLSNGIGRVWIKGHYHPIIGKICMDMTMIDITDSDVAEGDEVEIFGSNISLYELAGQMDTIPYEVLTGISSRVKRIYYME